MVGILVPSHEYCISQEQAWALSHETYEEMRENEINTKNNLDLKFEHIGPQVHFGHIEYNVSLRYLSREIK